MRTLKIVVEEPEKVLKFLEDHSVHIYAVVLEGQIHLIKGDE